MEKIVVLSCTNRPDSNTLKVSGIYRRLLAERGVGSELFDLRELPADVAFSESDGRRSAAFAALMEKYVLPYHRFVFVLPEYNGSFPGILKVFIDSTHPREWENKFACLVGIAEGRAGNLRGLEHLTGILNYMRVHVYHNKLPISAITRIIGNTGDFIHEAQLQACAAQIEGFLNF